MESWKNIIGLEGKYSVSSYGRLLSLRRNIGNGTGYAIPEKVLKPYLQDGYLNHSLTVKNRKNKRFPVHILVASHFIGKIPFGSQVCHKDGNKLNNAVSNLYIGNHITNTIDRYKHGQTKLTIQHVGQIRVLLGTISQQKIAKMFGVRQSYISRIKTGDRCNLV